MTSILPLISNFYRLFSKLFRTVINAPTTLFTDPSAQAGYDTRSIFKRSLTGLNSEFSFFQTSCLTKAEESSLSYYLPIAGGRIIGFIPFPRVLVLCELQSVLSRIWTRVAMSISYDDNHYPTGTNYKWYHCHSCSIFSVFEPGLGIWVSFRFLLFSCCGPTKQHNALDDNCFFFLFINTNSYLLARIWWSFRIAENFMSLILLHGFKFVHLPFDSIVKF